MKRWPHFRRSASDISRHVARRAAAAAEPLVPPTAPNAAIGLVDRRRLLQGLAMALPAGTALSAGGAAHAAPAADLWERWLVHDEANEADVDHGAWDRFLKTYLVDGDDGVTRVAYRWVTAADSNELDAYVAGLEATPISTYSRAAQRAYWINFYNALTVRLVLAHYPVASILDIDLSGGFFDSLFGDGPWQRKIASVAGVELSLDDIEHRILRPIWGDPRIHYGLNCAALGCPNLRRHAFSAENGDAMLDEGARSFINHPRGVAIIDGELVVSSLYVWYESDFGGDEVSVISHLRRYAGAELSRELIGRTEVDDEQYNWTLNDMR